jgi:hypothetical protein
MAGPRQRVMLVIEFNPEVVNNETLAEALRHAATVVSTTKGLRHAATVVSTTKVLPDEVDIIIAPKYAHESWPQAQVRITSDDPNPEVPY